MDKMLALLSGKWQSLDSLSLRANLPRLCLARRFNILKHQGLAENMSRRVWLGGVYETTRSFWRKTEKTEKLEEQLKQP